jgi:Ca-activated chloride channel homolog
MIRFNVLIALVVAAASLPAAPGPRVRIVSPADDAMMTGRTRLRAEVEPAALAASGAFFVDGHQVCTVLKPPFECEWDAGPMIASHQVRFVVNLIGGGRIVSTTRTAGVEYAETVDVDVVQVTVTVMDEDGGYVKGLPRSAFRVSEDGRPQTISHFYSENVPLELVVAVDMSASMKPAVPAMKKAVAEFLGAVPARDRVTLLGFNSEVFALTRKAADPAERIKAVNALNAWGATALYEGILHGVDILGLQPGRKALVVFTDGEDQGSHVTFDEVEQLLQSSDLILYMIGQGRGVTSLPLQKVMDRLSRPTGGRALSTNSIDELQESFNALLEELSNQYVLGYQPTNAARDNTWREIKVDVAGHSRIRARHGYRAARR